jgi:hypothetical protein
MDLPDLQIDPDPIGELILRMVPQPISTVREELS